MPAAKNLPMFSIKNIRTMFVFFSLLLMFLGAGIKGNFNDTAYASSQVSLPVVVEGSNAEPGDIIVIYEDKFLKSFSDEGLTIYGVVTDDPVMSIRDDTLENTVLVSTVGETLVKVTALGGEIKTGDFISASKVPGVGQKASASGQVLGVALEDFNPENPSDIGTITVLINVTSAYVSQEPDKDLIGVLKSGVSAPVLTPLTSLRYIIAALIVLISFYIGFTSFGKISVNSVEAVGRNPLASKAITATVIFNFIFTVTIISVGLVIAYLILIL